jgi:SP family xylose:H+ symportor-like MFS transporter
MMTMAVGKSRGLVLGLTLIATLGGLLFGYDTAVISGAVGPIDVNFIDPLGLPETTRSILSGLTVASALFGCVIGGALAGVVGDKLGRKRGLMVAAALFLICSLGSAVPEFGLGKLGHMGAAALVPFNIYRVIGGVGVGLASLLAPLYIAEIAPPSARGRLVSFQQLAIVGGMNLVYFVNYRIALHGDDAYLNTTGWRWMFASEAIPALLFLLLLLLVPETPRWLVLKGRDAAARSVLSRLTDEREAALVLQEIETSLKVKHSPLLTFGPLVLVVGVLLSLFQQLVGINAVLYYAPMMFKTMGASAHGALLQTVMVGGANVVFTIIAMLTVDSLGRKPLLIIGGVVMAIAMLGLGVLFASHQMGLLSLVLVLVYIAGFAFSWGPVVWVMLAEMFPNPIKGQAMAIAVAAQWLANLGVSWSFKVIDSNSVLNAALNHGFAYLFYGVMSLLAALFVWRFVPETKGRTLEAMQDLWGRGRRNASPASTHLAVAPLAE